jgi:hypothetical protein
MGEYEERYCAFIDFLGFSNAVINGTLTPAEIIAAMRKARSVSYGAEDLIDVTQFSDSLVLSIPVCEDWAFLTMTSSILYLHIELMQHGILLRGGISKGRLYHQENLAFGPAFIRAYQLEQAASTPRVILDTNLAEEARWPSTMSYSERQGFLRHSLPEDTDDWRYVDYLSSTHQGEFDNIDGLAHHYLMVENLIDQNKGSDSPSIRTKYGWLRNKLNEAGRDF